MGVLGEIHCWPWSAARRGFIGVRRMAFRERVVWCDRPAGTAALPASASALADPHALSGLGRADLELPTLLNERGGRCASFPQA